MTINSWRASVHAEMISARGIIVLVREVIRLRTDLALAQAIAAALTDTITRVALVGTTRESRLAVITEDLV